ncbi:hypothetical protein D2E24_1055 [Bifidobacterium samirii]|uniref:Uncharacterized protein n=1 Tax=Bifidobacterium samirii TaxID=2306974 RepID=A0A430FUL2_9BIFI|nr:hypothetical protein D2E24_1055 [Bifidobacterium samirii]
MPPEARRQARRLRRRSNRLGIEILRLWRRDASDDLADSFAAMMPDLFQALDQAQYDTAADALASTPTIMRLLDGTVPDPDYTTDPWQWVGVNGNGRNTLDTMWSAVTIGRRDIAAGTPTDTVLDRIGITLVMRSRTMLADTHRSASAVAARARRPYARYVRCLTPPSCARCVILAGKPSGAEAFQRHPNCDCTAVYTEHPESGMLTDPTGYLNGLDDEQLARLLGRADARAYRDGADIYQLVNARRNGIRRAQIGDARIKYTLEGTTRRGAASHRMISSGYAKDFVKRGGRCTRADRPRLMPETIYERCANNPQKAKAMLYAYGWIR